MITRDDVMPLLVAARPTLAPLWADLEHEAGCVNEDGSRLHYLDAGEVATHLVALHRVGAHDEVRSAFAVIERLHLEGDPYVRELATIGYLEDVEGEVSSNADELAFFESVLGPESARWWSGLQAFWAGRAPYVTTTDA